MPDGSGRPQASDELADRLSLQSILVPSPIHPVRSSGAVSGHTAREVVQVRLDQRSWFHRRRPPRFAGSGAVCTWSDSASPGGVSDRDSADSGTSPTDASVPRMPLSRPSTLRTATPYAMPTTRPHRARRFRCSPIRSGADDFAARWLRWRVRRLSVPLDRRPVDPLPREDDPSGADRGDQPAVPADQVRAVPAARPGHARRLPARRRRGAHRTTSTSSGSTSTTTGCPTSSSSRSYITSARRSYELADCVPRPRACTSRSAACTSRRCPTRPPQHADTVFFGPGEDTWPRVPRRPAPRRSRSRGTPRERTLAGLPPIRRDLIQRHRYLVPNSIVVSRGCPHHCDFCYKDAFFDGGKSFYTQAVDDALAEIDRLPGRHLYFLDDHLFGNRRFATALFAGMRGMGRVWQARRHRRRRPAAGPAGAGRRRPGCAASSSASRRSTPTTSPRSASGRTSAATTARSCAGCTTRA